MKKKKCLGCGAKRTDVKHRVDKGKPVGELCDDCFDSLIMKFPKSE